MTEPSFELYAFWRSSATFRVRVALNLKGLKAREILIDLDAGEQLSADFLAVNPQGAIPALIEPGHPPLTQSLAILEYLEERFPTPPLLPERSPWPGPRAFAGRPDGERHASADRAAREEIPHRPRRIRRRRLAGLAGELVHARFSGHGGAPQQRAGHRRFLPWRHPDHRGYLPRERRRRRPRSSRSRCRAFRP